MLSIIFIAYCSLTQAAMPTKDDLKEYYDKAKETTEQAIDTGKQAFDASKEVAKETYETTKQWVGQASDATQAGVNNIKDYFKEKPLEEYQKVHNYKACIAVKKEGDKNILCLPNYRPFLCPEQSFKQLADQHLIHYCN